MSDNEVEKAVGTEAAEVRPKRVRRTKAQIEADRAAEEAARAAAVAAGEPVKPKRVRRTKAQIEADRAAEEAARAAAIAAGEPVKPKRVRRTKAQIEADRAAEEAARTDAVKLAEKAAQAAADRAVEEAAKVVDIVAEDPEKSKRVRRTKAQIEADRAAEEAAKAAAFEAEETVVSADAAVEYEDNEEQTVITADIVAESEVSTAEETSVAENSKTEPADENTEAKPVTGEEGKKPWWGNRPVISPEERAARKNRVEAERKAAAERRAREGEVRDKFLNFLAIAFPKAIFVEKENRLPLKVGIVNDILERLKSSKLDSQFEYFNKERYKIMHNYCHSLNYLQKLADGVTRVDLDGNYAGEIEEEHRNNAREEIEKIKKEIYAKTKAKKKSFGKKGGNKFNKFRKPAPGVAPSAGKPFNNADGAQRASFRPNNNRFRPSGEAYQNRYNRVPDGEGSQPYAGGSANYQGGYRSDDSSRGGYRSYNNDQGYRSNSYNRDRFNTRDSYRDHGASYQGGNGYRRDYSSSSSYRGGGGYRPYNANNSYNGGERSSYNGNSYNGGERSSYNGNSYNGGERSSYNSNSYNGGERNSYNGNSYNSGERSSFNGSDRSSYNNNSHNSNRDYRSRSDSAGSADQGYTANRPRYTGGNSYPSDQNSYRNSYRSSQLSSAESTEKESSAPKVIHRRTFTVRNNNNN